MDVKNDQVVPLEEMILDIIINAVTASFNVKCELDLNKIPQKFIKKHSSPNALLRCLENADTASNNCFKPDQDKIKTCSDLFKSVYFSWILILKLNNQKATVIIRSTGKCSVMGADSEGNASIAAKQAVELLHMCGFQPILDDFKINNIWAYCLLPWRVQIEQLAAKHKNIFEYEPEICNQCSIKIRGSGTFAAILPSGYIRVAACNREDIGNAVTHLLSFVYEFRI